MPLDNANTTRADLGKAALEYARKRIPVFPCRPGLKSPATAHGFKDATTDPAAITAFWMNAPNANIAMVPASMDWTVVDIDPHKNGEATWSALEAKHGKAPETYSIRTRSGGRHLYFKGVLPSGTDALGPGVDIKSKDGYVLLPPSFVEADDKGPAGYYKKINPGTGIARLPDWVVAERLERSRPAHVVEAPPDLELDQPGNVARAEAYLKVQPALVIGEGSDHRTFKMACDLRDLGMSEEKTVELLAEFQPDFEQEWIRGKVASCWRNAQNPNPGAYAVSSAAAAFAPAIAEQTADSAVGAVDGPVTEEEQERSRMPVAAPQPVAAKGSEIELAAGFAELYRDRLRYIAVEKKWFTFDGKCWREDATRTVRDMIRHGLGKRSLETQNWNEAQKIASSRFIAGVEAIAQVDRRLAASVEQWDAEPAILCTPRGIVDLTTGAVRPARPEDYCRKMTSVAPAAHGAPFPMWQCVLDNITGGDKAIERYLQKVAGYCLYGEQVDKAFFIPVGETDSGKTTAFEAWLAIMGDYATSATTETFLEDPRGSRSTNDLAELAGFRLVIAAEPDEDRKLSAARLKRMVGNDTDRSRRLYQSGVARPTTFKVILHCNKVPHMGRPDPAVQNRLHIIPAGKSIPKARQIRDLREKLRDEYPAILRWMIDGCVLWRKEGIEQPAAVAARSRQYFESEDPIAEWLGERTERDRAAWTASDTLYTDYCDFTRGSIPLVKDTFAKRLADVRWEATDKDGNAVVIGFERMRRHVGQGFGGIKLKGVSAV